MDALIAFHAAYPYWVWLGVGLILLAVEASLSTEWLLWPAVAAGVVAVLTALGLRHGIAVEVIVFGVLTAVLTLMSKRLIKKVNPADVPDVNARDSRFIGRTARVVTPFVNGQGRVFISGAEWAADIAGDARPEVGAEVVVEAVSGARLKVRAVSV